MELSIFLLTSGVNADLHHFVYNQFCFCIECKYCFKLGWPVHENQNAFLLWIQMIYKEVFLCTEAHILMKKKYAKIWNIVILLTRHSCFYICVTIKTVLSLCHFVAKSRFSNELQIIVSRQHIGELYRKSYLTRDL